MCENSFVLNYHMGNLSFTAAMGDDGLLVIHRFILTWLVRSRLRRANGLGTFLLKVMQNGLIDLFLRWGVVNASLQSTTLTGRFFCTEDPSGKQVLDLLCDPSLIACCVGETPVLAKAKKPPDTG